MRATSLLLLSMLTACSAGGGGKDDTDVGSEDTDTVDTTDTTPDDTDVSGGDTDQTPADTDQEPAFTVYGTWSLTAGRISSVTGSSPPCPAVNQAANPETQTLTWAETGDYEVSLSGFNIPYHCVLAGNVATCTAREGSSTSGSGYYIGYLWPLTITLGAEGSATVEQDADASCHPIGSGGSCSGVSFCESRTTTWTATKN